MNIQNIMAQLEAKHPGEKEYLQAVHEVLLSIEDVYNQHPEFEKAGEPVYPGAEDFRLDGFFAQALRRKG